MSDTPISDDASGTVTAGNKFAAVRQVGSPATWENFGPLASEIADYVKSTMGGRHAVPIVAGAMQPSVTGGCAALVGVATAANRPDLWTLDFDQTTEEYAQFSIPMPKSWNEGTITYKALWSHPATATNFKVAWALQAVAVSDDDSINAAFGTAVQVNDTGGTTDDIYVSPESSAITIGGTPQAEDVVFFRLYRVAADGTNDTLAADARLHGIVLFITTNAETDA